MYFFNGCAARTSQQVRHVSTLWFVTWINLFLICLIGFLYDNQNNNNYKYKKYNYFQSTQHKHKITIHYHYTMFRISCMTVFVFVMRRVFSNALELGILDNISILSVISAVIFTKPHSRHQTHGTFSTQLFVWFVHKESYNWYTQFNYISFPMHLL